MGILVKENVLHVQHAIAVPSMKGGCIVSVDIEHNGDKKRFSSRVTDLEAVDAANRKSGHERIEALYWLVHFDVADNLAIWLNLR